MTAETRSLKDNPWIFVAIAVAAVAVIALIVVVTLRDPAPVAADTVIVREVQSPAPIIVQGPSAPSGITANIPGPGDSNITVNIPN